MAEHCGPCCERLVAVTKPQQVSLLEDSLSKDPSSSGTSAPAAPAGTSAATGSDPPGAPHAAGAGGYDFGVPAASAAFGSPAAAATPLLNEAAGRENEGAGTTQTAAYATDLKQWRTLYETVPRKTGEKCGGRLHTAYPPCSWIRPPMIESGDAPSPTLEYPPFDAA